MLRRGALHFNSILYCFLFIGCARVGRWWSHDMTGQTKKPFFISNFIIWLPDIWVRPISHFNYMPCSLLMQLINARRTCIFLWGSSFHDQWKILWPSAENLICRFGLLRRFYFIFIFVVLFCYSLNGCVLFLLMMFARGHIKFLNAAIDHPAHGMWTFRQNSEFGLLRVYDAFGSAR